MSNLALSVSGLTARYGTSQVLFGVDLDVARGQVLALLGRNGAGKTTTFRALMRIVEASGRVVVEGSDCSSLETYQISRNGLGYVPEDRQVFPQHTVHQNLEIGCRSGIGGHTVWTVDKVYQSFPLLLDLKNRQAGRLSGGEQQMLSIGRTLVGNPAVLLLDEPSEGLAPIIVDQIAAALKELKALNQTVVIAEQNMHFCMKVATHVAVLDKGKIVFRGERDEFLSQAELMKRYLSA